jgi:hypothetical protein
MSSFLVFFIKCAVAAGTGLIFTIAAGHEAGSWAALYTIACMILLNQELTRGERDE